MSKFLDLWIQDCDKETLVRKVLTTCHITGNLAQLGEECDCPAHKLAQVEDALRRAANAAEELGKATAARVVAEEYAKNVSQDIESTRQAYERMKAEAESIQAEGSCAVAESVSLMRTNAQLKQDSTNWQNRAEVAE